MQNLISVFLSKYSGLGWSEIVRILENDSFDHVILSDIYSLIAFREFLLCLVLGIDVNIYVGQNSNFLGTLKSSPISQVSCFEILRLDIIRLYLKINDLVGKIRKCTSTAAEIRNEYLMNFGSYENTLSNLTLEFAVIEEYLRLTETLPHGNKANLIDKARENLKYKSRLQQNQLEKFQISDLIMSDTIAKKQRAKILNVSHPDHHYDYNEKQIATMVNIFEAVRGGGTRSEGVFYGSFSNYVKNEKEPLPEILHLGDGTLSEMIKVQKALRDILQSKLDTSFIRLEEVFDNELARMSKVLSDREKTESHKQFLVSRVAELEKTINTMKTKYDISI